jgi:hypothetical protein
LKHLSIYKIEKFSKLHSISNNQQQEEEEEQSNKMATVTKNNIVENYENKTVYKHCDTCEEEFNQQDLTQCSGQHNCCELTEHCEECIIIHECKDGGEEYYCQDCYEEKDESDDENDHGPIIAECYECGESIREEYDFYCRPSDGLFLCRPCTKNPDVMDKYESDDESNTHL